MAGFKLLINGELVDGDATMDVVNPATEGIVATCARASEDQLNQAVAAAKAAFPAWSATSIDERRKTINAIADVIEANGEELARLLTQEQGKPLSDATGEVFGTAAFFRYFTSLDLPIKVLEDSDGRRVEAHRKPLGVIGAIVPWNFPMILMAFKLPPALLAVNTVVLKPAPTTPLTALRLGELIKDILPAGVVNVIADGNDLGAPLTAHPDVRKISFTGSTATGAKVMAGAAGLLKRITLELGGNDAGIVLEDVNPKETAPKLFESAFRNSGQVCIAMKRLYVHESIYDEMCDELATLADEAVIGDGLEQGTQLGPLQNKMQFEKVKELIEDAGKSGKNERYLNVDSAIDDVLTPAFEGLADKLGPLLFQFPPQGRAITKKPEAFADSLHQFFIALPKGVHYAVELRDEALMTERYVEAITAAGVRHCYCVHPRMPSIT